MLSTATFINLERCLLSFFFKLTKVKEQNNKLVCGNLRRSMTVTDADRKVNFYNRRIDSTVYTTFVTGMLKRTS